ncbi:MAG TPA: hypothetical protein VGZ00_09775, partial [Candidatus Baltobacteraceae bacterium]|nr:hypothetical protein [Candidatus Baltobacteraceae bacterium]
MRRRLAPVILSVLAVALLSIARFAAAEVVRPGAVVAPPRGIFVVPAPVGFPATPGPRQSAAPPIVPIQGVNPSPTPSSASTSGLAKSQIPTLANVTLGQALSVFEAQFSAPDLSAMQSGNTYWAWRTLNDQAWIVVSFVNGVVNSVQLTPQKHNVLTVADTARVAMGSDLGTLLQRRGAPLGAP